MILTLGMKGSKRTGSLTNTQECLRGQDVQGLEDEDRVSRDPVANLNSRIKRHPLTLGRYNQESNSWNDRLRGQVV